MENNKSTAKKKLEKTTGGKAFAGFWMLMGIITLVGSIILAATVSNGVEIVGTYYPYTQETFNGTTFFYVLLAGLIASFLCFAISLILQNQTTLQKNQELIYERLFDNTQSPDETNADLSDQVNQATASSDQANALEK